MSTVPCPLQFVINNGDDEGEAVYTMIISSPGGLSRYFMVVVAEDGYMDGCTSKLTVLAI